MENKFISKVKKAVSIGKNSTSKAKQVISASKHLESLGNFSEPLGDSFESLENSSESMGESSEPMAEEFTKAQEETDPKGYYDAETPEKCTEVSKLHNEFYLDLKTRHDKAKEDFQVYHTRLQELVTQQQAKVAHHSTKLTVEWATVSKS